MTTSEDRPPPARLVVDVQRGVVDHGHAVVGTASTAEVDLIGAPA